MIPLEMTESKQAPFGMSGREKLLKSMFFQPVFFNVVFSRKREKGKEIGGERASWSAAHGNVMA